MARIAGVDLPREKRVEIGLTYIYGIGRASAQKILEQSGVDPDRRVHQLTDEEVNRLRRAISARSTPSTRYDASIARRRRLTSSSVSWCTRRSGSTPDCSRIFWAEARPMP